MVFEMSCLLLKLVDLFQSNNFSYQKIIIFIIKNRLNPKEKEEAAEALVNHCRERWENLNKKKSNDVKNRIGDLPFIKYGCDDITVCIAFLYFVEEEIKLNAVIKNNSNSKKKN